MVLGPVVAWLVVAGCVVAMAWCPAPGKTSLAQSFFGGWGGTYEALPVFGAVPEVAGADASVITVRNADELKALPVSAKAIRVTGFMWPEDCKEVYPRLKALESIEFAGHTGTDGEMLAALAKCPKLKRVISPESSSGIDTPEGLDALRQMKALEHLDCQFERSGLSAILSVLAELPAVSVLRLYEYTSFTSDGNKAASARGVGRLAALKELNLRGTTVDATAMGEIVALPALRKAAFDHSTFDAEAAARLGELALKAESLSLRYCRLHAGATFALSAEIAAKAGGSPPVLADLDLSCAFLGGTEAGSSLVASLASLTGLHRLDLSCYVAADPQGASAPGPVSPEALMTLAGLKELREVNLGGHNVNGDVLAKLASGVPKLESLGLSACPDEGLTKEALGQLASFRGLRRIDLASTGAGKDHAEVLAGVARPLEVSFASCKNFGDDACDKLAVSTTIISLDVSGTTVSDKGLKSLAKLPELTRLNLSGTIRCTPASWPSMPKLEVLWLDNCCVGDKGMPTAAKVPKLAALSISGGKYTRITGESVKVIAKYRNLRHLDFTGVKATDVQVGELRGMSKLEWLILGEDGLTKNNEPVKGLLGAGGFGKLRRLDVRLFAASGGDGATATFARMEMVPKLEEALVKRLPGVRITVRTEYRDG
jgi:hypothetical protein